jgi:hypothetical protein
VARNIKPKPAGLTTTQTASIKAINATYENYTGAKKSVVDELENKIKEANKLSLSGIDVDSFV